MNPIKIFEASLCRDGQIERQSEEVLEEEALQICINDREFSMTMRTPGDDRYLVRGLLHSQGLAPDGFLNYREEHLPLGTLVNLDLLEQEISSNRQLMSTSSCGLCGEKNLDNLFADLPKIEHQINFDSSKISLYYNILARRQKLFKKTGGSHSAAAFTLEGKLLCSFEDIGRHNAVDKVIGSLLENNQLAKAQVLCVSSRISYEIVQKCIRAGIPVLTGISAPSSLAVEMAKQSNLIMAAFCRQNKATFYSGSEHLAEQNNLIKDS